MQKFLKERIWICQGQLHGYFSCRQQGKFLTSCSMPSFSMIYSLSWREWGNSPGGRRPPRAPGRGQDAQDRPARLAWGRRQGPGGLPATTDGPGQTGHKAAERAGPAGRRLETEAPRRSRAVPGDLQAYGTQTPQADARGEGPEPRAACLLA